MENYQNLSWDEIKAMYAETSKLFKETGEFLNKIAHESKETDKRMGQSENRVGKHFYYVSDLLNLLHIALRARV